ncbi:carbohydrate ABC transporter permease [Pedococcus sp. 5OH_020]|uniref:carbohydrate ABC transporter permease n=1 Tax=Pedococcus sp. 5OH_020 TaxID=2989814 RepID=UPI0022E9C9A7|nr:sugar ABC transporter permease [Pedococcus sp. 5OH_020]
MLSPALVILAGFILYPAVNAIYVSLTDTNLLNLSAQQFVGLDNFIYMFGRQDFRDSLRNSAVWTFGNVTFQLVIGMIGALILNARFRGRGLIRGVVLLPWATPSVLVALMWLWILDPNLGLLNHLLRAVGLEQGKPIAWLADQHLALPTLMAIDIWQGIPFFAVMILAALQGVPTELLESAKVDGANAWQTYWRVVLPLIMPTVLITVILRLIWTANYFDLILVLTNGGPANATLTLPLNSYITSYKGGDFGGGAALGVVQAVLLAVLVAFYMRQVRRSEIA